MRSSRHAFQAWLLVALLLAVPGQLHALASNLVEAVPEGVEVELDGFKARVYPQIGGVYSLEPLGMFGGWSVFYLARGGYAVAGEGLSFSVYIEGVCGEPSYRSVYRGVDISLVVKAVAEVGCSGGSTVVEVDLARVSRLLGVSEPGGVFSLSFALGDSEVIVVAAPSGDGQGGGKSTGGYTGYGGRPESPGVASVSGRISGEGVDRPLEPGRAIAILVTALAALIVAIVADVRILGRRRSCQ